MGWGRYYGGWGRRAQPGKKATAASLSTATLQRIIDQQKAQEEATARYYAQQAEARRRAEERAAEEARLEALHGGKEGLAKWRFENAEKLEAERQAKIAAERQANIEAALVKDMAELRTELAALPRTATSAAAGGGQSTFQINKAQTKQHFHLTDRELEVLPKQVIMKEGAKKPSKILWSSGDIFAAVARKEGKKRLRQYQALYSPSLARKFIEDELAVLETKHPSLVERARAKTVSMLRASDDAAIAQADAAEKQVEAALKALEAARDKQRAARTALRSVATEAEIQAMNLVEIPEDEEPEEDDGYRSTHPKAPVSRTPFTAAEEGADGARKKQRTAVAGSSSASSSALLVD